MFSYRITNCLALFLLLTSCAVPSAQAICDATSANSLIGTSGVITNLAESKGLNTVTVAAPPATGATEFPTATLSGGGGQGGELAVTAQVFSASVVHGGDSGYAINDVITISRGSVGQGTPANIAVELTVASVDSGVITAVTVSTAGAFTAISDITAVAQTSKTGSGVGTPTFDLTLSIASIAVSTPGSGYTTAPTVTLGGAGLVGQSATATLDSGAINAITVSSLTTGVITSVTVLTAGAFTAISDITAVAQTSKTGSGVGTPTFDLTLSIASIAVSTAGTGYTSAPTVTLGGAGLAGQIATASMSDALTAPYTSCDANSATTVTLCAVDEYVSTKVCTACAAGTTNAVGDDASGADTTCDAILCAVDEYVSTKVCTACAAGTTNAAGDDASGADTICDTVSSAPRSTSFFATIIVAVALLLLAA